MVRMRRVRFAPSPTGTLHIGNALSASPTAASATGCCCGSTTQTRPGTCRAARRRFSDDLEWLGVEWDEGPVRQSERGERYREAAEQLGVTRFDGVTLLREDGSATYQLASVVDDGDFGITHVIRGNDHRPNEAIHRRLHEALGTPAARVPPPRADPRRRREEALEARRGRDRRVAARSRHSGRSGARVSRGARPAQARRAPRPAPDPEAGDPGDRGSPRRRAGAPGAARIPSTCR